MEYDKVKTAAPAIIILLLAITASALSTANFTIESAGMDICIKTSQNKIAYACEDTGALTVSGTQDHFIQLVPYPMIKPTDGLNEQSVVRDVIRDFPDKIVGGWWMFALAAMLAAMFAYVMLTIIGGKR